MSVSIVIPLFNKERTVERALRSVVAQSYADFEVIVVDDGSTDRSAEFAKRVKDRRIRIISTPNHGPGAARNRGVAESRGEIVAFLDSDDEWLPHYLAHALTTLERCGSTTGAAVVGYELFPRGSSTETMWRRRGLQSSAIKVSPTTPPELVIALVAFMSPWNTIVRRAVFERWGGFCDTPGVRYAEDSHLWLKLVMNTAIGVSLTPPCARYHTEDSELVPQRSGPRPVEPYLLDPRPLIAACPPDLVSLLHEVLARRALKTACMLGYWGRWREARCLVGAFRAPRRYRSQLFLPAHIAATPLALPAGAAIRAARRFMTRPLPQQDASSAQAPQRNADTAPDQRPG
jgi:hypothetical protein